ncbi:MAG: thermonuclease family protein, partial [Oscillospiraceae bacterium]
MADGDTITVLTAENIQIKVRLYGIDCPEKKQDFGQKAKEFTASLVFDKQVDVKESEKDRYGRTIGRVYRDGKY